MCVSTVVAAAMHGHGSSVPTVSRTTLVRVTACGEMTTSTVHLFIRIVLIVERSNTAFLCGVCVYMRGCLRVCARMMRASSRVSDGGGNGVCVGFNCV